MRNRSNLLVLIGIAFFVVGGIIVYVVTNGDDGDSSSPSVGEVTVVVSTHDIAAGAKATDEINKGGLKEVQVASGSLVPGAIQSLQQLDGATFVSGFKDDQQILGSGVQTVKRGYKLPEGYEAIAVQLGFPQGVAGYVSPGDRINLYGSFKAVDPKNGEAVPNGEQVHLFMTNVRVLDVNQTIPANGTAADGTTATARTGDGSILVLLAVKTHDAERIVYMQQGVNSSGLYGTLVTDDAKPAGPTAGADLGNILDGTADSAA